MIAKVTSDFERWSYNTAVAACMEHLNALSRYVQSPAGPRAATVDFALDSMLLLLAPMAPHISAELWERRHPDRAPVHATPWPVADPAMLAVETVTLVVQVNGKVRGRVEVAPGVSEEEAVAEARAAVTLTSEPARVVARPPRLVNFVLAGPVPRA